MSLCHVDLIEKASVMSCGVAVSVGFASVVNDAIFREPLGVSINNVFPCVKYFPFTIMESFLGSKFLIVTVSPPNLERSIVSLLLPRLSVQKAAIRLGSSKSPTSE